MTCELLHMYSQIKPLWGSQLRLSSTKKSKSLSSEARNGIPENTCWVYEASKSPVIYMYLYACSANSSLLLPSATARLGDRLTIELEDCWDIAGRHGLTRPPPPLLDAPPPFPRTRHHPIAGFQAFRPWLPSALGTILLESVCTHPSRLHGAELDHWDLVDFNVPCTFGSSLPAPLLAMSRRAPCPNLISSELIRLLFFDEYIFSKFGKSSVSVYRAIFTLSTTTYQRLNLYPARLSIITTTSPLSNLSQLQDRTRGIYPPRQVSQKRTPSRDCR